MKLPNRANAIVPESKIAGYLLAEDHSYGRHKAAFFSRFGFSLAQPGQLVSALIKHAADNEVAKVEDSPFGCRYVIQGMLQAPDGRNPLIRSVWFLEADEETPRFVTAYPVRRPD